MLFCGINPGLYTAAVGHHFARPGNRFWPALHAGGFTERLLDPSEEQELLALGYGITNLVDVRLLGKDGSLRVRVLDGAGNPVANAAVEVEQGTFPREELQGVTGPNGELVLTNLFEGFYFVRGPGVAPGPVGAPARAEDFAPTIARLLGVELDDVDGRAFVARI